MEVFIFGKFSCMLSYVSDMKKSDFDNEFKKVFDVKEGWKHLQTFKKEAKEAEKESSKK